MAKKNINSNKKATIYDVNINNAVLFAGGYDAEMVEILNVCRELGVEVVDKHLSWGAKVSDYAKEIAKAVSEEKRPVLVELTIDMDIPSGAVIVDHHNENADRPSSLQQILDLFGLLNSTRYQDLVSANDSKYIPGMLELGATPEEIAAVRCADRAAQGVTPEQEAEAERAIADAEVINGVVIVKMSHSKSSTVCDRLFDPELEERLLILSEKDSEANFFGNGELCKKLRNNFGGWMGGNLSECGYWGCQHVDQQAVEAFVVDFFGSK